jgi:hypothetical protein
MPPGVEFVLFDGLRDLPQFNPDLEVNAEPEHVRRWRLALEESDAVLIASPEYGLSLPGALKNGIDWVIGSGELERKVVAITASVAWDRAWPARTAGPPRHPVRGARNHRWRGADSQRSDFESEVGALVQKLLQKVLEMGSLTLPSIRR